MKFHFKTIVINVNKSDIYPPPPPPPFIGSKFVKLTENG